MVLFHTKIFNMASSIYFCADKFSFASYPTLLDVGDVFKLQNYGTVWQVKKLVGLTHCVVVSRREFDEDGDRPFIRQQMTICRQTHAFVYSGTPVRN